MKGGYTEQFQSPIQFQMGRKALLRAWDLYLVLVFNLSPAHTLVPLRKRMTKEFWIYSSPNEELFLNFLAHEWIVVLFWSPTLHRAYDQLTSF